MASPPPLCHQQRLWQSLLHARKVVAGVVTPPPGEELSHEYHVQEQALNAEADRIEQQAGNADGGMTTANTPNTSPSRRIVCGALLETRSVLPLERRMLVAAE